MAGVKGRSGGRNAKTRSELERAGTFRKDRHGAHRNPEPPEGVPEPPRPLEGEALAEWHRMIARLTASQALSTVDDGALYQYCQLFAETEGIAVVQAETAATARIIQENLDALDEITFEEILQAAQELTKLRRLEAGYITKVRQGRMALRILLTEFGLTPASRSRVKLPDKTPDADPFENFQKQKPTALRAVK